jgi:hypothetical protein
VAARQRDVLAALQAASSTISAAPVPFMMINNASFLMRDVVLLAVSLSVALFGTPWKIGLVANEKSCLFEDYSKACRAGPARPINAGREKQPTSR